MGELGFQLGSLSREIVLQFDGALESSGEPVKTQMAKSHHQSFWLSKSGMGPKNLRC